MSKKSSDDQKASSNRLNFSRLVGMIARFSGNSRRIFLLAAIMLILEAVTALLHMSACDWVCDQRLVSESCEAASALPQDP